MTDGAPPENEPGKGGKCLWPQDGGLSKQWEGKAKLRIDLRLNKEMLRWPKKKGKETKGVPSMAALSLNLEAVQVGLEEWIRFQSTPKSPPVDWLKQEARHESVVSIANSTP